jgi:SAM-dependent methyltransferase
VTSDAQARRYGIELDAYRAEQASSVVDELIHGNCFDVQCPIESFSLVYLNPPYDFEVGEGKSQRMERLFLEHVYRWLKPGGVLAFVIPGPHIEECIATFSVHFRDVRVYRLTEPESVRYKQIVLFGVRRTRSERERLQDADITRARQRYASLARQPERLSPLPPQPDHQYVIPPAEPVRLVYRGLPLDQVEDLLPKSSAYRQAAPILFAQETVAAYTPWHLRIRVHLAVEIDDKNRTSSQSGSQSSIAMGRLACNVGHRRLRLLPS